jgi:hypothetical protein
MFWWDLGVSLLCADNVVGRIELGEGHLLVASRVRKNRIAWYLVADEVFELQSLRIDEPHGEQGAQVVLVVTCT